MSLFVLALYLAPIIEMVLIVALRAVRPYKPKTQKYQTWAITLAAAYIGL